jgi:3-methyladenine DNA glycosylase AlkD
VTPETIALSIERALAVHTNAERRAFMSGGYAPSGLRAIGVAVPHMRAVVREFSRELKDAPPRAVIDVALALVRRGTTEGRQVGWELIARRPDAMAMMTTRPIEQLGRSNDNWASVDGFGVYLAGVAWRLGHVTDAAVLRWARSRDRWWRRTALVVTVPLNVAARGGQGDTRRTLAICAVLVADHDPMIAKALSWALRALVGRDSRAVRQFLDRHRGQLASLVVREVSTKLATGRKN